jgi:hypothetical protein
MIHDTALALTAEATPAKPKKGANGGHRDMLAAMTTTRPWL